MPKLIHDAEGIVLRHYSLSEADRIIVLFTRERGKVRAIGQGVKKLKSRIAGSLEPLNHVHLQLYAREGAELEYIRQADLIHSYLGKSPSVEHLYAFCYWAEIVNEIVQDNHANPSLYRLLLASLKAGETLGPREALVHYFEIWALRLSGLLPKYDTCSGCGLYVKDVEFFAWPETGQVRCPSCAGGRGICIHGPASSALNRMFELSPDEYCRQPMSKIVAREIERLAQRLIEFHLEKQLKSYHVLRELFRGQQ